MIKSKGAKGGRRGKNSVANRKKAESLKKRTFATGAAEGYTWRQGCERGNLSSEKGSLTRREKAEKGGARNVVDEQMEGGVAGEKSSHREENLRVGDSK